ncbi:MAG: nicotinate-nucleotide adenylyltransferase [Candidatus Zhuqueibacterota bacterium]
MTKIGLFGGSFDPIHYGHLQIADWTRQHLALEKIIFIPAAIPPHKLHSIIASAEHRYTMIQLAIAQYPHFEISDVELNRTGISYTIDTVNYYRDMYSLQREELFLLIGGDSLMDLPSWRFPDKILSNCTVVVYQRRGTNPASLPDDIARQVRILDTPIIDISSTMIREKIAAGESITNLTSPHVAEYISVHHLYGCK